MTDDSIVSNKDEPGFISGGAGSRGNNNGEMPTDDDLETFRIVFELFDRDRSGYIDNHDLSAIAVKLGKDPSEGKQILLFR